MNSSGPKGPFDRVMLFCVGFLMCVIAIYIALYLLAQIWYWVVLLIAIGAGVWTLIWWLRGRSGRW